MPQVNTVAGSNKLPSSGLGNQTSETQFTGSDSNILTAYLPGSKRLANQPTAIFKIVVGGRVTIGSGGTATFTPKLYFGNSTTIGSNTGIMGGTASSALSASATSNWYIEATLVCDTTSKKINGWGLSVVDAVITQAGNVPVTLLAQPSSVDMTAADVTTVGFSVTALFGTSRTGNTAFVDFFDIQEY